MKHAGSISLSKFSESLEHLYEPLLIEHFPQRLFSVVSSLIPEVMMSFDEVNKQTGQLRHARNFEPPNAAEWLERLAVNLQRDHPGMAYLMNGGSERVLQMSDFLSQRQLRDTALYRENYLGPGIEHQVAIVIPHAGYFAGLAVNRGGKFREAEVEVLRLLSPHFARAHANARFYSACQMTSDDRGSEIFTHGLTRAGLTVREAEVLKWIAQGKRNSEIGEILEISARTVGKHVQNLLSKLHVETRTAAVNEALRLAGTSVEPE